MDNKKLREALLNHSVQKLVLHKRNFLTNYDLYELEVVYLREKAERASNRLNISDVSEILELATKMNVPLENGSVKNPYLFLMNPNPIYHLATGLLLVFTLYLFAKQSTMLKGMTKKIDFKRFGQFNIRVRYRDVAGLEEAKNELAEYVDFLKYGSKYAKMGAKVPRGALPLRLT